MRVIICDRNRIETSTISAMGWTNSAPASNVKNLPLSVPARSLTSGTEIAPVTLEGVFRQPETLIYAGLFTTNFRQSDDVKLELFDDDLKTEVAFDSDWTAVVPPLQDWRSMRWGASNFFRGDLPEEDFALYPTNVHMKIPLGRYKAWRWSFKGSGYIASPDPDINGNDANYHQVGYAWFSDGMELEINPALGSSDDYTPQDVVSQVEGGGEFVEPGTGFRSININLDQLSADQANKLLDLIKRVDFSRPLVYLPDLDDLALLFRYAFVGQNRSALKKTWRALGVDTTALQLKEITR